MPSSGVGLIDGAKMKATKTALHTGINTLRGTDLWGQVCDEVRHTSDPVTQKIRGKLVLTLEQIDSPPHARVLETVGIMALWMLDKNPSYRDPLIWFLKRLQYDAGWRDSLAQVDQKPPSEWTCNISREAGQGDPGLARLFDPAADRRDYVDEKYREALDDD